MPTKPIKSNLPLALEAVNLLRKFGHQLVGILQLDAMQVNLFVVFLREQCELLFVPKQYKLYCLFGFKLCVAIYF